MSMIEHMVVFKFNSETTPGAVDSLRQALMGLKEQFEGIVDLTFGENFSERGKGFTHGLVVRFKDKAALDEYLPHDAHQAVVRDRVLPILDELVVVDYEIGS